MTKNILYNTNISGSTGVVIRAHSIPSICGSFGLIMWSKLFILTVVERCIRTKLHAERHKHTLSHPDRRWYDGYIEYYISPVSFTDVKCANIMLWFVPCLWSGEMAKTYCTSLGQTLVLIGQAWGQII